MFIVRSNQHHTLVVLLFVVIPSASIADSTSNQCDFRKDGKTGSKDSVVLSLYTCNQAQSSSKAVCNLIPSSTAVLNRNEVVDMKHDVNSYAVTAKFFGEEVCVSYRDVSILNYKETKECASVCFTEKETITYKSRLICNINCAGGFEKLRFVVTGSGKQRTVTSLVALVFCAIVSLGVSL